MSKIRIVSLLSAFLLLFVFEIDASAYNPNTRVWPNNFTNFRRTANFNNQGTNWLNTLNDAANEWTGDTVFAVTYNTNSQNDIDYGVPSAPYANSLAVTYWYWDGTNTAYRSRFNMIINSQKQWWVQSPPIPSGHFDLQSILVHEFGHALGLGHADNTGQVMYASFSMQEVRDQVQDDEKYGMKFLYDSSFTSPHPTRQEPWGAQSAGYYDDPSKYVGYKGQNWTPATGLVAPRYPRGNTLTYSNAYGASTWFQAHTDSITWEYTKHHLRGWADIYIDGTHMGLFNLDDNDDTLWRVRRTWELPMDDHLIQVRNVSGGDYIDADTFIAGIFAHPSGTYDDSQQVTIEYLGNNWTHSSCCPTAYNSTISWSRTADEAIELTFRGSAIYYVFTKAYNRGKVKVTIDGELKDIIDLYASPNQWQVSRYYGLTSGIHTIHLAVTGDKNPNSTDYYVDLDYFIVQP